MSKIPSSKGRAASSSAWTPSAENILSALFEQALRALEAHNCRPLISGKILELRPSDGIKIFDYSSLNRADFDNLDELRAEISAPIPGHSPTVTPDHIRNHKDIRGVAFDLLTDTIDFKERLDDYRSEPSALNFDAMLTSLHSASRTGGVLHSAYDANFESDLRKLKQQPAQKKGRETKKRRVNSRDVDFVRVAQNRLNEQLRAGKKRNLADLARHVSRHYKKTGNADSLPSEKRISAILREHLK